MDPEMWFPEKNDPGTANEAKMICFGCPVRIECRSYQEETHSEYGIWGAQQKKRGE